MQAKWQKILILLRIKLRMRLLSICVAPLFFAIDEKEIEEKNISQAELIDLLSIRYALWKKAYYKFIPQEIAIDISLESLAELKENKDILPGVTIVEDPVRKYLYPSLCHIF